MSGARGGIHDLSEQAKARFFPHDLDDDWRHPDLAGFAETASSSARRLLSACEVLWRAEAEEGRDLANGSVYAGTCGAALLLYKLAMMTNDDGNDDKNGAGDEHKRVVVMVMMAMVMARMTTTTTIMMRAMRAMRMMVMMGDR